MEVLPFRISMDFELDFSLVQWLAVWGGANGLALAAFLHACANPRIEYGEAFTA